MPIIGRAIGSPANAWPMIGFAMSIGMAKPSPWAVVLTAVLIPMTCPALLTSGPPELPGLMAASVWMRLRRVSGALDWFASLALIIRPSPDTIPVVTVFS